MHLRSLRHVVEAVEALVHPARITIMGSSSLLAFDATLGDVGQPLELSLDADLLVEPADVRLAAVLHEAVGEGSLFHREYGVYADLLRPDIDETLPAGWRGRCTGLNDMEHVYCLDRYDLALAKLALAREKDLALLRGLVERRVIDLQTLRRRYQDTPMVEERLFRTGRALAALSGEA
jgi:hypothetical protein